ncbi:MAG TPA: serine hydrolase domain-containing protein [Ktedonobacterales bacterium]|nr:serine hydrolase domain-containing protein [Ktedonobacterales bacterium]
MPDTQLAPLSPSQRAIVEDEVAKQRLPGLAVAIVANGRVAAAEGFGYRRLDDHLPMTIHTSTPIASLTKSLTATVILRLAEEGALGLDEPVVSYLPDFRLADAGATRRITPRMLLAHTSGLGHTGHQPPVFAEPMTTPYAGRAGLVARLAETTPQTAPGAAWSYSNEGYSVLGLLVDRLSGVCVEEYLRTRIFEPLEMGDTVMRFADWRARPDRALGYLRDDDSDSGFKPSALPQDYSVYAAGGGVCSSAVNFARYLAAALDYADSPLLSAGSLDQMQSASALYGDTGWGYGLGWFVSWAGSRKVIAHSGGLPGHTTYVMALPWERMGVVALANGEADDIGGLTERLLNDMAGAPVQRATPDDPLPLHTRYPQPDAATLAAYIGAYAGEEVTIEVGIDEGALLFTVHVPNYPTQTFRTLAVGPDLFMTLRWGQPVRFLRGGDGRIGGFLHGGAYYRPATATSA